MTRKRGIEGWWFAARDPDGEVRLPHGDGRIVRAGEVLSVEGKIDPCVRGLHASKRAMDALRYAPSRNGLVVCRVRLIGTVVAHGEPVDKHAASERTVLWMADCDKGLRRFACDVAEAALLMERRAGREPDRRSWNAITVARRYVEGAATIRELAAADAAAWEAADAAAWAAAEAASEAAWMAAWAAAKAAARAAAEAASEAAWMAAWEAARAAADRPVDAASASAVAVYEPFLITRLEECR